MSSSVIKTSPMMAQWEACKQNAKGAILLFRLGDFYEAFHEDAELIAKELDLTLTKRQEIPMAGVPHHTCESYIDKLVSKGYRVAIAEQMEDPSETKGIVKREIVRIVTPGTVVNSSLLADKANNFLICITHFNALFGLAILDLTTADFRAIELEDAKLLLDELTRLNVKEILLSDKCYKDNKSFFDDCKSTFSCTLSLKENWHFDHRMALERLLKHFNVAHLDGFGLKDLSLATSAAGALLAYVQEDLNLSTEHLRTIRQEVLSKYMALDRSTQRHLELSGDKSATLLQLLDRTATPMGGRLLKQWLTHPLLCPLEIKKRQDAIEALFGRDLLKQLQEIRDLERLMMKIETGFASPRDLVGLRFSLEQMPSLVSKLQSISSLLILEELDQCSDTSSIAQKIATAIEETAPLRLHDGGIIKTGFHPELDNLRQIKKDSHAWIAEYQAHLKAQTNIKTLKVGFTKAFGYYIEVSRGQADKIPENFQRRQTLVNAERFITPELKEYEHKVLTAEERIQALEEELFHEIRREVAKEGQKIRSIAQAVANIDCLYALSCLAQEKRYVRPIVDLSDELIIIEGRHPVIETFRSTESFIPNDVHLSEESRLLLITGPNMAGKSTYIRQVALLTILAQMGSFIPAKSARIGIVDKIFTRIGASDDLSRGQSTFMVEMAETANILHNATSRSLVILDEIGRGTSTYDGISIAWAVAEFLLINKDKRAKTLFATHYWELTELEGKIPGAMNYTVSVHESDKGIVFLRKIVKGKADKSYGIHVARLAGLPPAVLRRAEEMLGKLEKSAIKTDKSLLKKRDDQLSFI